MASAEHAAHCTPSTAFDGTQVTQGDEKELGEIARSIEALFAREEVVQSTEAVASGGAARAHPDVATALGLEGELDAATEPDLKPALGDTSEADPVTPADVEDRQGTPIEAEPQARRTQSPPPM